MIKLPQTAQTIIDALQNAGFEAYAVGGSVRDLLMEKPTKGWDFTTNATPQEILELFPDSFYDNQFGTVGMKIYQSSDVSHQTSDEVIDIYEITTYRSEHGYSDRRHPDTVTWGRTIEADLARRDFTINAIACDGKHLIDPYDGQKDIDAKIIRAVGDPIKRFSEDALRIIRAVRIATQLGFIVEPKTTTAIKKFASNLTQISAERVRDELIKLLSSEYPADGVLILKNTGILKVILPELDRAFDVGQKSPKRHHIYDVGTHLVESLRHAPTKNPVVRLATLLHDIGKPLTVKKDETSGLITFYNHEIAGARLVKSIASRLRFSKKESEKLYTLTRWHQFTVDERQTDSAIRRFIRRVGTENLTDMLALRIGDRLGGGALETSWRLELYKKRLEQVQIQPFTVKDLKINGLDVMKELSIAPGPLVGKILNQLFAEVDEGTLVNEREVLLTRLRQTVPQDQNRSRDERR